MYEELKELVLGSVHVRVRPDGQVNPFYDKIMLCLSPNLLQNERYQYLVDRFVQRPRQSQEVIGPIAPMQENQASRRSSTILTGSLQTGKTWLTP